MGDFKVTENARQMQLLALSPCRLMVQGGSLAVASYFAGRNFVLHRENSGPQRIRLAGVFFDQYKSNLAWISNSSFFVARDLDSSKLQGAFNIHGLNLTDKA